MPKMIDSPEDREDTGDHQHHSETHTDGCERMPFFAATKTDSHEQ
jgi:hypothetical protein